MGFHIFFLVDSLVQHLRDIERDNRVRYGRYGWGKVDAAAVGGSGPAFLHLPHEVSGPVNRGIEDRHGDGCQSQAKKCYEGSALIDRWTGASWRRQMPCVDGGVGRKRGAVPNPRYPVPLDAHLR